MIYFILTETFKKNFKRLGKKYPSIKEDLSKIMKSLSENPERGGGDVTITLVAIYDKSDLENISDLEIKRAYEY